MICPYGCSHFEYWLHVCNFEEEKAIVITHFFPKRNQLTIIYNKLSNALCTPTNFADSQDDILIFVLFNEYNKHSDIYGASV